jgi:hypothetical protein
MQHAAMDRWSNTRTKADEQCVLGAMGVPADEAHPAETPAGTNPESSMEDDTGHADGGNDVEMDFVGQVGASQGIGSFEPSFDDEVSAAICLDEGVVVDGRALIVRRTKLNSKPPSRAAAVARRSSGRCSHMSFQ